MRSALGLGLGVTQGAAGGGAAAPAAGEERITNGGFSSATGWSGANWVIAGDVATNTPAVGNLTNTLTIPVPTGPLAGGEGFLFTFDVVANPAGTAIAVSLAASGGSPAPQLILSDMTATTGAKMSTGSVDAAYDQLRIRGIDDPGLVIDNVSFIA